MPIINLTLSLLPYPLAVCRLDPLSPLPDLPGGLEFWSITRTADELSLVLPQAHIPPGARFDSGWQALKVEGPLDFSLTGILAALSAVLAAAGISIFAISTFDTDYILVKTARLAESIACLRAAGYTIIE